MCAAANAVNRKSTLLIFIEAYSDVCGAASHLVDLANGAAGSFDEVVIASNPGGLPADTQDRIHASSSVETVRVLTPNSVWEGLHAYRYRVKMPALRVVQVLDPFAFAYNVRQCRELIRRVRPAAVLSYNGGYPAARAALAMVVAGRRERVPVLLSVVSMPAPRRRAVARYDAWLDARIGEAADLILVNAHNIADALVTSRGLPRSKMRVVHNALPDSPLRVLHKDEGRVRIGCVARMDELKGTPHLVAAFARLAQTRPDIELILVGDGPERPNVESVVAEHGLQGRVTMTGWYLGDIPEMVASFDIYAFPSLWEGLPFSILEAMRAGCAIVSTDVGGIPEALKDGETALLIEPGSTDQLYDALLRLVDDPRLRRALGDAARERFVSAFSLDVMHAEVAAVFRDDVLGA